MIAPAELNGSIKLAPRLSRYKRNDHVLANVPLCILRITKYDFQVFSSLGFEEAAKFYEGFSRSDRVVHVLARFSPPRAICQESGPSVEATKLASHLHDWSVRVDRALLAQHLISDIDVTKYNEWLASNTDMDDAT
jgi:hypothetical protein